MKDELKIFMEFRFSSTVSTLENFTFFKIYTVKTKVRLKTTWTTARREAYSRLVRTALMIGLLSANEFLSGSK